MRACVEDLAVRVVANDDWERGIGTSMIRFWSMDAACPAGIASTTCASPVRSAAARAVPSGTKATSMPAAFAFSPQ